MTEQPHNVKEISEMNDWTSWSVRAHCDSNAQTKHLVLKEHTHSSYVTLSGLNDGPLVPVDDVEHHAVIDVLFIFRDLF